MSGPGADAGLFTPSRPVDRHISRIRLQLTALYATTLLLFLLGSVTALRFALSAALERQFTQSVVASASLVQQFFHVEIAEYRTVEATLAHIAGELVFEDRAIQIRRPDGTLLPVVGTTTTRARREVAGPVRTIRLPLDPDIAPAWTIEVQASSANTLRLQRRIDRWFVVAVPLLVLVAGMAGWGLTGRTLRPVGQALAQQRRFIADAAHELRTPIARMRSRVELAQLDAAHGRAPGALLGALNVELMAATRQVDELLQLARADAGGDDEPLRATRFFLDDLVAEQLTRWQPEARRGAITLSCEQLDETPVLGDHALLSRTLDVLIDNAIRYGRRGGHVHVRVAPHGPTARLQVEDDGLGIPLTDRAHIFDRFYRGEHARQHRADGSGLGLSIAAWGVSRHRGTIAVADGRSGGTCMTVEIPLARA